MTEDFDEELFRCLKAGLEELTEAERRALVLIWRHPNIPVKILPTIIGNGPGGSVWLRIGLLAKKKVWSRMPRRIKSEFQRPGRKPFYSGLLVNLDVVEDFRRTRWTVFELRPETVKVLQVMKVISRTRPAPSSAYKLLDDVEVEKVPAGFTAPAETKRINRSIIERRGQTPFRRDLMAAYSGQCAVTGCAETNVLEAAHIVGMRNRGRYEIANGLLLRADWHTLFDLGLWAIHPTRLTIEVSPKLAEEYRKLGGRRLCTPVDSKYAPRPDALKRRYDRFRRLLRG
ncbi:HNH endonuclease [Bradyrhizobium sp. SRS-191]|uniref:HNH endonuclease n=1 Tax=Bradyrhizobium sp. SRS-191 TaxID=2962606 RepID=UPI00211EEF70|nr:HNH endonuclease signature motif containing protein [Bradyrhizobium sp. SRS-191]